jgi:hypothetical protein
VGRKNLLARSDQPEESAPIKEQLKYVRDDRKFDVEIREIVRIKPVNFEALLNSFEEWAKQWQ